MRTSILDKILVYGLGILIVDGEYMFSVFITLTMLFMFVDGTGRCQIDCSIDSRPSYKDMALTYKLTEMNIRFDSVESIVKTVVLKKSWCFTFLVTDMKINISCKQPEWQGTYYCIQRITIDIVNEKTQMCQEMLISLSLYLSIY